MSELMTLLESLQSQRHHVLGILEGLSDEQLRRPVLPSGWSCLGMVRHLAIDDERFWFRNVVDGQQPDGGVDAWDIADASAAEILELYRREIALADAVLAGTSIDAGPKWWPEGLFGEWRLHSVRDVVLHMITETACHAGHLDAARELIDGRQWMVPG